MQCKKCGAEIPSANVNIQLAIAKCDACNAVFGFGDELAAAPAEAGGEGELRRPASGVLQQPKNLGVENTGSELRFSRRFFNPSAVFMTIFALFWDAFMIVWYAIAFSTGEYMMAAFGSLHAAVGLGFTYNVLAMYINSRRIAVNRENLIAWAGPLPWPGARTVPAAKVSQIYSRGRRVSRRGGISSLSSAGSFEVWAVLRDESEVKLMAGLDKPEQAFFIEQEIERFLHISDRPAHARSVL